MSAIFAVCLIPGAAAADVSKKITIPTVTVSPDVYYPFDETLYIEGRAEPESAVQVQLQKQGSKSLRFSIKSDSTGEWVLAERIPMDAGDWEVRARAAGDPDQFSDWSNPRIFKVIINGVTLGGVNIKFSFLTLVIFFLLAMGGAIIWYFLLRVRQLKAAIIKKEIREAHESVHEGLAEIRRELLDETPTRETRRKSPSGDTASHKDHVLHQIDHLEKTMEQEIEDIEEKA